MTDLVGKTLGRYRIVAHLGRGGLAEVYKAYQPGLDRYVAIKVLHSHLGEDKDFIGRFEREALAIGKLRHLNIVQALGFDRAVDLYFMAMEFIDGPTLKAELKARNDAGKSFSLPEIAHVFTALCSAIGYAHSRGMVHRDIKPSNVMITKEGQVVLTDFGIARIAGATQYTQTGALGGSPTYMSPEQGQGERGDERSDIYALGIMLYEMVTGTVPYDADTPFAIIMKHISEPLPSPTQVNPDLPEGVERVILKAMSKDPDDRYQTAGEMAKALREAVGLAPGDTLISSPLETIATSPVIRGIDHPTGPITAEERAASLPLGEGTGATLVSNEESLSTRGSNGESVFQRIAKAIRTVMPFGAGDKAKANPPQPTLVQSTRKASEEQTVSSLRLDAAIPDQVRLGRTFDLAVAVRQYASATLAETDLTQVSSGAVQVSWPEAEPFARLRVQVKAPECKIQGEDSYDFRLYPDQDSPVFYFHLTPQLTGEISIIVTVYQENDWLGSARVHTVAHEQIVGEVQIDVTSHPVSTEVDSLRRQLKTRRSNLLKLQEQAAIYGTGAVPLHLLNQIEAEQEAIANIEAKLA